MNEDAKQIAKEIFSKKLQMAIRDNNLSHLSYKKLGKFFGVTDMAVHSWLNAKGMPAMTRLPEIAKKLSVSVEFLMPIKSHIPHQAYLDDEQQLMNCYRQLSKQQQDLLRTIAEEFKGDKT